MMVVTDLHGDREAFGRYVGRFLNLRQRGKVQRLLFLGDLIHSTGPEGSDESLRILLDVMRMQRALPEGTVTMLLGNHEMPHIYGVTLAKGKEEYTPRFEAALTKSEQRDEVIAFLKSLPFYVRTAGGVAFTHAGPHGSAIASMDILRNFDHDAILDEFTYALKINPLPDQLRNLYGNMMGMSYEVLARYYMAVSGPDDPRYDDLLRGYIIGQRSPEFELLWDILFTRCEDGMIPILYERLLATFLAVLSEGGAPQRFLVTGHIGVEGGHQIVTPQHLRLASATHAHPREAGQFLLVDCARPVDNIDLLERSLGSVF
jgi:hypothetical protein